MSTGLDARVVVEREGFVLDVSLSIPPDRTVAVLVRTGRARPLWWRSWRVCWR